MVAMIVGVGLMWEFTLLMSDQYGTRPMDSGQINRRMDRRQCQADGTSVSGGWTDVSVRRMDRRKCQADGQT